MPASAPHIPLPDWTLLVLAAARGEHLQPVQLQKALFLLGQNVPALKSGALPFYQFRPYDYGPFCSAIYRDLEDLQELGDVIAERSANTTYVTHRATPQGLRRAADLRGHLPTNVASYLDALVAWVRAQSFASLLRSVYQAHPDMAANSVFQS